MGLHAPEPVDPRVTLTSFNESVEIKFDVEAHTYTYNEQRLKSATAFVRDYEEPFDGAKISASCASKWSVDQDEILNLWESNGRVASGFGTAIHAVLEHYYQHKALGKKIQDASGKEHNAALPNHPFLQQLIFSLDQVRPDGEAHQEALVSCVQKGLCGLVDDLLVVDQKKKICRIRDYKITFDILVDKKELKAPFGYLGSNKLAKNFLQLSFYAYLMELSGWKVEGIDIFNWNGDWKRHSLTGILLRRTIVEIAGKYAKSPK